MEESVTQRVNEYRVKKGLSVNAMAKALGIRQETLNKQLTDGGYGVSTSTISLILMHYPDISAEWLLRGRGPMERGEEAPSDKDIVSVLRENIEALKEVNELLREKIRRLEGEKDDMEGHRLLSKAAQGKVKMLGGEGKEKISNVNV